DRLVENAVVHVAGPGAIDEHAALFTEQLQRTARDVAIELALFHGPLDDLFQPVGDPLLLDRPVLAQALAGHICGPPLHMRSEIAQLVDAGVDLGATQEFLRVLLGEVRSDLKAGSKIGLPVGRVLTARDLVGEPFPPRIFQNTHRPPSPSPLYPIASPLSPETINILWLALCFSPG